MATPTVITSSSHFNTLLSAHTTVIADFHATWCGPCKTIAPIFSQLASAHTSPGKVIFVKIDVDAQQEIAQKYSVSAMPTFLIFRNGSVADTIRGANPGALRTAVVRAAEAAKKGPARGSAAFGSAGRTLAGRGPASGVRGWSASVGQKGGMLDWLVRFVALYVVSLFAFDASAAAEKSAFRVR